jgi:hypothetical protein
MQLIAIFTVLHQHRKLYHGALESSCFVFLTPGVGASVISCSGKVLRKNFDQRVCSVCVVAAKDELIKHHKVESCVLTEKPTPQQSNWNTTENGIHKCKECVAKFATLQFFKYRLVHDAEFIVSIHEIVEMIGTNFMWWKTVCIGTSKLWFSCYCSVACIMIWFGRVCWVCFKCVIRLVT